MCYFDSCSAWYFFQIRSCECWHLVLSVESVQQTPPDPPWKWTELGVGEAQAGSLPSSLSRSAARADLDPGSRHRPPLPQPLFLNLTGDKSQAPAVMGTRNESRVIAQT